MADLKKRLHAKNASGTYDTIHLEVDLDNVVGVLSPEHGGSGGEPQEVEPVQTLEVEPMELPEDLASLDTLFLVSATEPTNQKTNEFWCEPVE